jgi:hypothetical protein
MPLGWPTGAVMRIDLRRKCGVTAELACNRHLNPANVRLDRLDGIA